MPGYDANGFKPPAPVASVIVRSQQSAGVVENVPMLLDTGADVSLLPRAQLAPIVSPGSDTPRYELEAFDGTRSDAPVVQLEVIFMGKSFKGQFLLIDSEYGILCRNILNSLALVLDGPSQTWNLRL